MSNLCIIPARGGSKRIIKKNIKLFLNKPIISYSIKAAIKTNLFSEIMISTDDLNISKISKKYGVNIPFLRSKKNSNDYATLVEVLLEVIIEYEKKGFYFDYCCCLLPTAPFVNSKIILDSYKKIVKNNFDTLFPIVKYSFPIQRAVKIKKNKTKMFFPQFYNSRSQDLELSYHDAGQFYWFNVSKIKVLKKLWTNNTGYIEVSELSSQDIDNEIDWKLAELKYSFNLNND